MRTTPDPTEDEAVAIAAALHAAWPSPGEPEERSTPRWRFSGRWWSQPIPLRRRRPW